MFCESCQKHKDADECRQGGAFECVTCGNYCCDDCNNQICSSCLDNIGKAVKFLRSAEKARLKLHANTLLTIHDLKSIFSSDEYTHQALNGKTPEEIRDKYIAPFCIALDNITNNCHNIRYTANTVKGESVTGYYYRTYDRHYILQDGDRVSEFDKDAIKMYRIFFASLEMKIE